MCSQAVVRLSHTVWETKYTILTGLMKRLGSGRFARGLFRKPPNTDNDPYLLILLAEQEFGEGREEQASYLLEAAYKAFDRTAKSNVYRLRPAV